MSDSHIHYLTTYEITDADRERNKQRDQEIAQMLREGAEQQARWNASMDVAIRAHRQARAEARAGRG